MTDFYDLTTLTHPIPDEIQPSSSRPLHHVINATLRVGYNSKWDPRYPDRNGEPGHNGDDIYAYLGTSIFNPFPTETEVYRAGWLGNLAGYGAELLIPVTGGDLSYRGLHMNTVSVARGQRIAPGQKIGTVGRSGPPVGQPGWIRSPHCHTEIAFYPGGIDRTKSMLGQPRIELDIRIFLAQSGGGGGGGPTLVEVNIHREILRKEYPYRPRDSVRDLQALLAVRGFVAQATFDVLHRPDGKFGPGTDGALKAFQSAAGLLPDGVAAVATWTALLDH